MPFAAPSVINIGEIHKYLYEKLWLRQNDALLIIPMTEGKNVTERFEKFTELEKDLWRKQISLNVERQFYYVKGFDVSRGFFIPPGYLHLAEACNLFFRDNPNYAKNVFLIMKFDNRNLLLNDITSKLRYILIKHGYNPIRANDKMYMKDRDMWNNVCVYMACSKQGIAVLKNYSKQEYNPNVAIEYSFMRALNKRVLLLKDEKFPVDRADIAGKEMLSFNIEKTETIGRPIEIWLNEL
jgi:hypothetical protein